METIKTISGNKLPTTPPIQRDTFIPTAADSATTQYLWWTWLTSRQYADYNRTANIPGYKETRGDNVQKHHRLLKYPDHCVNLAVHTRWNAQSDNDNYSRTRPMYILVWKQSIYHIIRNSDRNGHAYGNIYYRRGEDISEIQSNSIQCSMDKSQ
eukprot:2125819-Amphidinium_carterae.2